MSKILSAIKEKLKGVRQNSLLKTVLISALVLALIVSATLAWYINNLRLSGMEFNTGNIDFDAYVYGDDGTCLVGPVSSNEEGETNYINAPLITLEDAQVGSTGTAYIMVKSTGSIGIQYRIAFDIEGNTAYLGGYKYNISKVADPKFTSDGKLDVSSCPAPDKINSEAVTIDRNAVNGTIEDKDSYDVYRVDFTLAHKNEEYTGKAVNIYFNIFATQIDGDFEDVEERGYTYYCSSKEDIDRARVEAYPGDIIKLSSDIVYYGDLVFNKPVNLETNDFTLTVNGNLMYDYVLGNSLKLNAGGLGKIIVQSTKEGIGGNFQIKAPISDVTLIGSNASTGDIVIENNVIIDATNSFGSAGISFNEVRLVDLKNTRKTIQLESNTRATVSFGTNIGIIQSVAKANNIEIINNGEIGDINLSNMSLLDQTNSPQIYILNNNAINNPIMLPGWSVKFEENALGVCTGNTRIVKSYSGGTTTVTGNCAFDNDDIEQEKKDLLVEQIEEGNDSRLRIYYQDVDGQITTIRSIIEDYLKNEATSGCAVNEILQLEIICIDDKAVTSDDIAFMNSDNMLSLKKLNLQRANVYDKATDTYHKLPASSFSGVSKYESLVLPQNLVEIGAGAFQNSRIENTITVPSGVTVFGSNWFYNGNYVHFAASIPVTQPINGLTNVKAVFVDEPYIDSYKSVYSQQEVRIYPTSVLDENKTHFIRNTNNDEWEITYYISGEDAVIGENITIEGTILKITSVYDNAYRHNFTGTSVKFADSVETLGAGNFYNNKNITEVDLNNLKHIGNDAFSGAASLAKAKFGNYLETIGANAFLNCVSLNQDVILPDTMQKIGASAFQKTKITSINTGGTTSVDGYAFANCSDLIYADLPNVKLVGENGTNYLFASDSALVSVRMPSFTKANGNLMFNGCVSLREVYLATIDDDINLGMYAFNGCDISKLKLFVPEEYIEFYRNKRPGNIDAHRIYPQGEKMGEELVNGFNIGEYIISENGDGTCTLVTSNIDYTDRLIIPETFGGKAITHIYDNAFRNQGFTNVALILGDNINFIGSNAFYQIAGLVKVEFGDSLEEISSSAFANCSALVQDIVLPDSMQIIGNEAFSNSGILSVNTGGTISIESRAFSNCTSLVYAKMPEVTVIAESGTNYVFSNCISLVSVDMPKVSNVYGAYMFIDCADLREVYMGSNGANVSLGSYPFERIPSSQVKLFVPEDLVAFYQGRNIISASRVYPIGEKMGNKTVNGFLVGDYIVLENGNGYTLVTSNLDFSGYAVIPNEYNGKAITEIYPNAFRNQTFTDAVLVLGGNVKVIGDGAFYGITGLKSIDVNQVTAIGNNAFYGTTGLKTVVMDQVISVGDNAFYGSGLGVLNAPNLTVIGESAFRKCNDLETVSVPKLETIEKMFAFAECTNLKSVYFENVMSLNTYTFYLDKNLEKITINRQINANGDNMPSAMTIDAAAPCKIYVPYRSLSAYPAVWSGKPVTFFDLFGTNNGNTYILVDNNGRYTLIDFLPAQAVTDLTLPNSVYVSQIGDVAIYSIREGAFSSVSDTLKSITLSSTVALLDGAALSECTALQNIYVTSDNMYFISVNGVLYSTDAKMLVKYPAGRSGKFDMTGADYTSTVGIGASAFANVLGLTQIVFPESLMVIDSTAFENCTQLNTVEFTGNVPPVLMGASIFDTSLDGFEMIIPTVDGDVVMTYLCAYNFGEYEPYIDLNGHAAPGPDTPRNQVPLGNAPTTRQITYAMPNSPRKDEEIDEAALPEEDETTGE